MLDINGLSGIEFENLCSKLLSKMQFRIEMTKISGDGGIDIVAYSAQPIFQGKYIVQCKRYSGTVGEPVLRDLYGVVMSERANKGILMTTGTFTKSAVKFAEGKNLELIDGVRLNVLLNEAEIIEVETPLATESKFNVERYEYLKQRAERTGHYSSLLDFLWRYFWNKDFETCRSQWIFKKVIESCQYGIGHLKGGKIEREHHYKICLKALIQAYIVTGMLDEATNLLLENGQFYIGEWCPELYFDIVGGPPRKNYLLARNLYSAFVQIGFVEGCRIITSQIHGIRLDIDFKDFHDYRQNRYAGELRDKQLFCDGKYDDFFVDAPFDNNGDPIDKSKWMKMSVIKQELFECSDDKIIEKVLKMFNQHGIAI